MGPLIPLGHATSFASRQAFRESTFEIYNPLWEPGQPRPPVAPPPQHMLMVRDAVPPEERRQQWMKQLEERSSMDLGLEDCAAAHHTTPHHIPPHHTTPQPTTPHHITPHHTTPRPYTVAPPLFALAHPRRPHHSTPHHTTPHHHEDNIYVSRQSEIVIDPRDL